MRSVRFSVSGGRPESDRDRKVRTRRKRLFVGNPRSSPEPQDGGAFPQKWSKQSQGWERRDSRPCDYLTWNKDQFLDYITDSKAMIPGTKMPFAGIENPTEAQNL
jgi:hypothetical protein